MYNVEQGERVRFHAVNSGGESAWDISVDNHKLFAVASDGWEFNSTEVDSVVIETGQTLDFEVEPNQAVDNYWIRARNITDSEDSDPTYVPGRDTEVKAILRYAGANKADPTSVRVDCPQRNTACRMLHCNHESYDEKYNVKCLHFSNRTSTLSEEYQAETWGILDTDYEEHFLNFGFINGPSINAISFKDASAPLLQEGAVEGYTTKCDYSLCNHTRCECTQILDLPINRTIQIVMTNLYPGGTVFANHPIHFHGTGYAVMRVGYARKDPNTGKWLQNRDVECNNDLCTKPRWTNGTRPPLNTDHPVVKDTLVVPAKGYTVVRFKAINPGYWLVHCHIIDHQLFGMKMVFNVAPGYHLKLPANFPRCYNYTGLPDGDDKGKEISKLMVNCNHLNLK